MAKEVIKGNMATALAASVSLGQDDEYLSRPADTSKK